MCQAEFSSLNVSCGAPPPSRVTWSPLLSHVSHEVSLPSHVTWSPSSLMCHTEPPPPSPVTLSPLPMCHTDSLLPQVHTEPLPTSLPFPLGPGLLSLPPLLTQVPCRTVGDPHQAPVLLESLTHQPERQPAEGYPWRGGADRGPGHSRKPPEQVMKGHGSPPPPPPAFSSLSPVLHGVRRASWVLAGLPVSRAAAGVRRVLCLRGWKAPGPDKTRARPKPRPDRTRPRPLRNAPRSGQCATRGGQVVPPRPCAPAF